MTTESWMRGYPPDVAVGQGNPEAQKYGKLWECEEYRAYSPGETFVTTFLREARPKPGSQVIDFGCGSGRAGMALTAVGLDVILLDFVRNSLDDNVKEKLGHKFVKADLEQPISVNAEYGYCTDVMEHIPPDK